ncbi:hypothetical protein [Ralstonia pseudosolanacearum]|uniref:hypothetical protein n=1 Tax=Ralstonia pseudosolanacearum TaxID=1310165 RepID=UPI000FD7F706|nr:hypothetical protein [Ralstonia pseudosolanacearum]
MASAWADATRRLGPGALALIAVIGLPGCANWSALANYPQAPSFCPPDSTMPACKDLNFVAEQVQLAGAEAHSVTRAMQFNLVASTTVDVATAGLATAFGVKLVHGNTLTTGAKNLAFAAGATYVAGTLFFPRTTDQAQASTRSALLCVAARGNDLLATYNTLATVTNAASTRAAALPPTCHTQSSYADMIKAQGAAQTVLHSAQDAQLSLAQLLFRARLAAHDGLQAQLEAQRPSQDAFLAAGKSMLAAVNTLAPAETSAPATTAVADGAQILQAKPADGKDKSSQSACSADEIKTINLLRTTFEGVKQELLDQAVNVVADASKDCPAATAALVSPLAVSQKTVVLHAGETGTVVVISGGRPPLTADWVGTLPDDSKAKFSWLVANQQLRLYAPAGAASGGPYKLQIRDSAARPASLDIEVTTAQ